MNFAQNQSLKIFLTSFIILFIGIIIIYNYSYNNITKYHLKLADDIVSEISVSIENHFLEKVKTVKTIAITPIILKALEKSNKHFSGLSEQQRDEEIQSKNNKWKTIEDHDHQFILKYTDNAVSQFLKNQQDNLKGEYGEIFITDKFGALIASTAKLTTFAHGYKYWWKGAYNNGDGAIFWDDRGYDDSVGGYVLGVVVPIKNGNEIIGILKANLNILGSISEMILNVKKDETEQLFLMRSGGLIVYKEGLEPLSNRVSKKLLEKMLINENSFILKEEGKEGIYSLSEIGITAGKQGYNFGGSFESIDHKKGNTGESWYIVDYHPISHIVEPANKNLKILLLIGLFLSVVLAITSMIIGNMAAKPVKELIKQTLLISKGDYNSKVFSKRTDEIGQLATSFNQMTRNLNETTTSLDNLNAEITERKRMEEALQNSEKQSKAITQTAADAIISINSDGIVLSWNNAAEKIFGFSSKEMINNNLLDIIPPQYKDLHSAGIKRLKEGNKEKLIGKTFEIIALKKDGTEFPVELTLSSWKSDKHKYYTSIIRDITERKKVEEALKESEDKYKAIFESLQDVFYRTDRVGRITIISPSIRAQAGYDPEDIIGHQVTDFYLNSSDRKFFKTKLYESGVINDYELQLKAKDGRVIEVSASSKLIYREDGSPVGVEGILRDITDRKHAEEALQKSNEELGILHKELEEKVKKAIAEIREKDHLLIRQSRQAAMGEMIGFIAHQWRQPLNLVGIIVQNYEDAFEDGILDLKYLEEHSDKVMDVLQQMSRTIDDFRNFFKPDKLIMEFNLKENIVKVIRFIEDSYKTNTIKLILDLDENCKVKGFPNEYSQVILNILNNARDAFDEGNIPVDKREVKIKLFKHNDKSIVIISDTARGIPEDIIDNIFESYFTTKSEDKGTGLGLYMSKTIVEDNMHGKLSVRNIDNGAEFRIEV